MNKVLHTTQSAEPSALHGGILQRAAINSSPVAGVPAIVHQVLDSPGQPLDAATRQFMEPRFGRDFSEVRVHTDPRAAQSARAVNALAYTVGQHVAFDTGCYEPTTSQGQRLLAHEMTHVAQQNGMDTGRALTIADPISTSESQAEAAGDAVLNGHAPAVSALAVGTAGILARQPAPPPANPGTAKVLDMIANNKLFTAGSYETIYAELDHMAMEVMLATLDAVRQQGDLPALIEHFEEAGGINKNRVRSAMEAARLKGAYGAKTPPAEFTSLVEWMKGLPPDQQEKITRFVSPSSVLAGRPDLVMSLTVPRPGVDFGLPLLGYKAPAPAKPATPAPAAPAVREPSAKDRAEMERRIQTMQIGPGGPYKQYGPGVTFPVLSQPGRVLLPVVEALQNAFESAGGFGHGVYDGIKERVTAEVLEKIGQRLLDDSVVSLLRGPLFTAGAAWGILEDVGGALKGAYETITNLKEIASATVELIRALFGTEGREIGYALGKEIGHSKADQITGLLKGDLMDFSFHLGELVGPTIVYAVLSATGAGAAIGAAAAGRVLEILTPLLKKYPRLLKLLEAAAKRMGHKGVAPSASGVAKKVEGAAAQALPAPSGGKADEFEAFLQMVRDEGGNLEGGEHLLELGPHGRAPKNRAVLGLSGNDVQSAHISPQAVMKRAVPGYNFRHALTRLMEKDVHTAMDRHWKDAFRAMRKAGQTEATAQAVYNIVADAIRQTPGLPAGEKASLIARLVDEMFTEGGLNPTDLIEIPKMTR